MPKTQQDVDQDSESDLEEDLGSDLDLDSSDEDKINLDEDLDLSDWSVTELKASLKERGISYSKLKKAGLIQKLTEAMEEEISVMDDIQRLESLEAVLDEQADDIDDDDADDIDDDDADEIHIDDAADEIQLTTEDRNSIIKVIGVAVIASIALYLLLQSMPIVTECSDISVKWLIQTGYNKDQTGLKQLHTCVTKLQMGAGNEKITICYIALYIFFQTFAVPGPNLLLSVLAGALFENVVISILIVAGSCTAGAVCCYGLSYFLLTKVMKHYLLERINKFKIRVTANKDHLLSYMLFLRLTPLLPNWFINLTSPVVGIPVTTFAIATFFGQMPMNLVYWYSGKTFFEATGNEDGGDPFEKNIKVVVAVALIGVGSLVPVLLKKRIEAAEAAMGTSNSSKNADPSSEEDSSENIANNQDIQIGSTVNVQSRMWAGINKPGGVARITKCNSNGSFNCKYVLGGTEKNIDAEYVNVHIVKTETRSGTPKKRASTRSKSKRR